jgi:hypothetical protein
LSYVVNFWNVTPPPRNDGGHWVSVKVEEGPTPDGPFLPLQTITTSFPADLTVTNAQYPDGWYVLTFIDQANAVSRLPPGQKDDFFGSQYLYTTIDDLRSALSPGGDDTDRGSAASLSDDDLRDAIVEAQSEVDARVPGEPFVEGTAPPVVSAVTRDIAAYLATLTHRRGDPVPADDPVQLRYNRAKGILTDIGSGKIELSGAPDPTAEAFVENAYEGDLFTLDDLRLGIDGRRMGRMPTVGLDDGWGGLDGNW